MLKRSYYIMYLFVLYVLVISPCITLAVLPDTHSFYGAPEDNVIPREVSEQCLTDTAHWMSNLRLGVPWALKMLDSSTKLPSGILMGGLGNLGNFDQCMSVEVQDEVTSFHGHYCRPIMRMKAPGQVIESSYMGYAICVPSSCALEEIPELLRKYIGPALGVRMTVAFLNRINCYTKEIPAPLSTTALCFVILIGLLTGIVVICAIIEWHQGDKTPGMVRACSVTNTCKSLFNISRHPADISCLHGLRVGSMLWVILGHRYAEDLSIPITNRNTFTSAMANPMKMIVGNAMLAVDTFFFLSGFLMCHSILRELHRNQIFDVFKFYIYRYLRLVIPYCIVIFYYLTILTLIGDGPLWNNFSYYDAKYCKANWWTNIIFVGNYIFAEGTGSCMMQTWYLAIDMQLAWLSPLVLLPLYHTPRAGKQLMTLLILISCFLPFTITYIFRFPMSLVQVALDIPMEGVPEGNFIQMLYFATHCRATPYLCSMIFCYVLLKIKNKNFKVSQKVVYAGWICCTAVALTTIFSLSITYQLDYVYNLVGASFYAGFHRIAWSAVLMWIIFACIYKYGGFVDSILSWKYLLPFSRLTYSSYLVHIAIMLYGAGITRTPSYFTDFNTVHTYFGDLIPIFFFGFLIYVLVEGPSLALLKIAFSKGAKPNTKTKTTSEKL